MQVFELHFNPKVREEQIFDSFVYEPENVYEKRLGNTYIVGELQNTLPQNQKFLDELAKVIKKNYYAFSADVPEKALSQTLKRTNEFLAEKIKSENVSWLGNLNFAVLSLKDFNFTFTKTGEIKILLLRNGQIIDIGKNLDIQEIEPYPLKVFFNVVSGKLSQDDIILVLTKEVFDFFYQQNLLTKISQAENINQKKIKEILPVSLFTKGEGAKVSGICFLALVRPTLPHRMILFQRDKKSKFNFKIPSLKLPKIRLPKIKLPKNLTLVVVLFCILFLGLLIFRKTEEMKEKNKETPLTQTEEIENLVEVSELEYKAVSAPLSPPENLIPPGPDFNFDLFLSYLSNLYFLDKKTCKIIKYPYLGESTRGLPQVWKETDVYCKDPKSMAIDGSIWLLNGDNSILRYRTGAYQETFRPDIFPLIENVTKIETKPNVPYLFLLEPIKKRVIVIDKTGGFIKQFQSQKFDNLTDFAISGNGDIIYLKNNSKIYKIEM